MLFLLGENCFLPSLVSMVSLKRKEYQQAGCAKVYKDCTELLRHQAACDIECGVLGYQRSNMALSVDVVDEEADGSLFFKEGV